MPQALVGTGGFLAAALWMDLMFDFQVLGHAGELPAPVLAAIVTHYHHVTEAAAPMGNVTSLVMLLTVFGAVLQLSRPAIPLWIRGTVLVLALAITLITLVGVVPAVQRLVSADSPELQSELARRILTGHLLGLGCVAAYLGLQITAAQRIGRRSEPAPA
ncbi:MAG TPA: hypothetical protein VF210_07865 [Pseudomonadales bacterium]